MRGRKKCNDEQPIDNVLLLHLSFIVLAVEKTVIEKYL
jgi:hypothetical protein